ncbi:MAG TPA: Asp-tRNA(Asn)/Glu-tRNA(Gln) amidotransferase subunit GatC [Candidatus Angelobacter sp.]|nr:Asp-tRNA(Asn)/Glu-tRNA(Gln) amidotransferase subunit GatC [Candidatus Angelobacter sp.]
MKVTEKDVTYVADLGNLALTEEERTHLEKDLNSILGYIDRLNKLDTSNVAPMTQVSGRNESSGIAGTTEGEKFAYAQRADAAGPCLPRDAVMRNAPDSDGSFFKVPKVIDK